MTINLNSQPGIYIHATAVAAEDRGLRAATGLNGFRKPKLPNLGSIALGKSRPSARGSNAPSPAIGCMAIPA